MDIVTPAVRTDLLIFSILLNIVLFLYIKNNSAKSNYSIVLLKRVILSIILLSSFEAISWLTGDPGNTSQIPFHYLSNALYLTFLVFPMSLGLSYLDYMIFGNIKASKRKFLIYMIPLYVSVLTSIYNIFNDGFLFSIDSANKYTRGIGIPINLIFVYVFLSIILFSFRKHKHLITGRITQSIIIYYFIPVVGVLLQTLAYGTTLLMPSFTLATFIVFLINDKDEMGKDELTDLYTRSKLASRLDYKIKSSQPFIVIMADLDGFKSINDNFGHAEGDKALIKVSEILRKVINIEDTVCRYGGDEFLLLIEHDKDIGDIIINRIDNALDKYNATVDYNIVFSYGYEFIQDPSEIDSKELINRIDEKMYKNKFSKKL